MEKDKKGVHGFFLIDPPNKILSASIMVGMLCVGVLLTTFLGGCQSAESSFNSQAVVYTPDWWDSARQHDRDHLYFKAAGTHPVSHEEARTQALQSIRQQTANYIFMDMAVASAGDAARQQVLQGIGLSELEIFNEEEWRGKDEQWYVWMQGRYPQKEYRRIRSRIELGAQLNGRWTQAQSLVNRQLYEQAAKELIAIIDAHGGALLATFDLEAAKLELAALYSKMGQGLKARQWANDVIKSATTSSWRQRAAGLLAEFPAISMRDALADEKLVVLCRAYQDGRVETDKDTLLRRELTTRLAKDGVNLIAADNDLLSGGSVMERQMLGQVAEIAGTQGASIALLVQMDIDSHKSGQKVIIPGTTQTMDVYDAALTYCILKASDGTILASNSISGYSNRPSSLLNTFLTHRNHFPKHAVAIAEALQSSQ